MKAEALVGRSVTVAVPATVANLGAGYDVLGLALEMTNELTVQVTGVDSSGKGTVTYGASGEGAEELAHNRTNMALDAVYRRIDQTAVADVRTQSWRPRESLVHWPAGIAVILVLLTYAGLLFSSRRRGERA